MFIITEFFFNLLLYVLGVEFAPSPPWSLATTHAACPSWHPLMIVTAWRGGLVYPSAGSCNHKRPGGFLPSSVPSPFLLFPPLFLTSFLLRPNRVNCLYFYESSGFLISRKLGISLQGASIGLIFYFNGCPVVHGLEDTHFIERLPC